MSLYLIARIGMLGVVCVGMALAASAGEIPQVGARRLPTWISHRRMAAK
jgi:hypothetical protein